MSAVAIRTETLDNPVRNVIIKPKEGGKLKIIIQILSANQFNKL